MVMEATSEAASILGLEADKSMEIHFAQGPLMVPAANSDLPTPEILCYYRSGIGKNGADPQTMVDTPAIVAGDYGSGRVVLFSPHPEKTPGLEHLLESALLWGARSPVPQQKKRRASHGVRGRGKRRSSRRSLAASEYCGAASARWQRQAPVLAG